MRASHLNKALGISILWRSMNVECLEYINDGAYAEVWLAIDELNRAVAVKAMKPSGAGVSTLQQHADVKSSEPSKCSKCILCRYC